MIWADLHCHTQASDGTVSPKKLVELAKEIGLKGLCITDHDTIAAYDEAIDVARELGICLGAGIEFSAIFEGCDVHLLGYDFDLKSSALESLCLKHRARRRDRNARVLEKLRLEGMEISDFPQEGNWGRPHIAQAMVSLGYVGSIKEAFHRYLGEGKRCYVQGEAISAEETIDVIHAAGGKAFIAHPHLLMSSFPVDHLLEMPFDGMECYYGNLSKKSADRWVAIAQKKGWLISGGSDFHGSVKPQISLGCQGVDKSTFHMIFEHALI
jgi:predicted metal-dependent phosphoesterase TrpH